MKLKITTLSPIHISSGDTIPKYLYHNDGDMIHRYKLDDILLNLQNNKKISIEQFLQLRLDQNDGNAKRKIMNIFKTNVQYKEIQPLYSFYDYGDETNNDIKEQIKSMSKPYIPGSSLKGAIMNVIIYHFIKEKIEDAMKYIKKNKNMNQLLDHLYGKGFEESMEYYKQCLYCRDIFFKDNLMILCHSERLNMTSSIMDYECIYYNQETEGELIVLDSSKEKIFKQRFNYYYNQYFKSLFSIDTLIRYINDFYDAMCEEDMSYFEEYDFGLDTERFHPKAKNNSECILRIGNSTNYFFKTVTLLFKKQDFDFYKDNFKLFSPVKLGMKNSPRLETMPKTRMIFEFNGQYYLPGLLKIEKCK